MEFKKTFFAISALVILISIDFISAELIFTISPNNPSILLNHGGSKTIDFSVENLDNYCSTDCYYTLMKANSQLTDSGTFNNFAGKIETISLDFIAPTKNEALQESGNIEYLLTVNCKTIRSGLCMATESKSRINAITLNYDLTQQEKTDKNYLSLIFPDIIDKLKDCEKNKYFLETKINNVPDYLYIQDIFDNTPDYDEEYINLKNNYDISRNLYEQMKFYESKINLKSDILERIDSLNNNIDNFNIEIDNRILLHNQAIDKLNLLKNKLNNAENKSLNLRYDLSSFSEDLNLIEAKLSYRTKKDYQELLDQMNDMDISLDNILINIQKRKNDIIQVGNELLTIENIKISKEFQNYSLDFDENIRKICEKFIDTKSSIEEYNEMTISDYEIKVNPIIENNSKVFIVNYKIDKLNQIIESINNLSIEKEVKKKESESCRKELATISKLRFEDKLKINLSSYKNCIIFNQSLSFSRKSKISSFFDRLMNFSKRFSYRFFKFSKIKSYLEKEIPEKPTLIDFSEESRDFNLAYCEQELTIYNREINLVMPLNNISGEILNESEIIYPKNTVSKCCSFNICDKCCENDECLNDEKSYPVIFLHGHSLFRWDSPEYSLDVFNIYQEKMFQEKYRIGGIFLPNDDKANMIKGELGKVKFPITFKATYYYDVYDSDGNLVKEPSKQESISVYADRIGNIVENVKFRTNRNKVNIIAYSMGGLVAREYIKNYNGDLSVNKLIMVGTPNHGVSGFYKNTCPFLGAKTECSQMKSGSDFINSLNSIDETPGDVKYYTIAGIGCNINGNEGDGVVKSVSVEINGAKNVKINGKCEDLSLFDKLGFHSNLMNIEKHPEVYSYIMEFLRE